MNGLPRLERKGLAWVLQLGGGFDVVSTCPVNGGTRGDLHAVANVQVCEGKAHAEVHERLHQDGSDLTHDRICRELSLVPDRTALLQTAAHVGNTAEAAESRGDLSVHVACTAGVEGNAGRAGGPSQFGEKPETGSPEGIAAPGRRDQEIPNPGTINLLLSVNHPLRAGAAARAIATLTEAKTTVLQELAVPSLYEPALATGTGTDQFAVISPKGNSVSGDDRDRSLKWTGTHSLLGELIGRAVRKALRDALVQQNGLGGVQSRHLARAFRRLGKSPASLDASLRERMATSDAGRFVANANALYHDPSTSGAAFALVEVLERHEAGALPRAEARELLLSQGALMATCLACKTDRHSDYRSRIAHAVVSSEDLRGFAAEVALRALVVGWEQKWK